MEIRELAVFTGVPAKTIRYYESIGVLPPPERKAAGIEHAEELFLAGLLHGARGGPSW